MTPPITSQKSGSLCIFNEDENQIFISGVSADPEAASPIQEIPVLPKLFKPILSALWSQVKPSLFQSESFFEKEGRELEDVGAAVFHSEPATAEESLGQFALLEHLAQAYLAKAGENPESEAEWIQLADETYEALGKLADVSRFQEIRERVSLYEGYRLLIAGDDAGAEFAFEEVLELPEAKTALETIQAVAKAETGRVARDESRMKALAVLDLWSTYVEEGRAYDLEQAKGVLGVAVGVVRYYAEDGRKTMIDHVHDQWNLDLDLIAAVEKKIRSDKAESVQEALEQISEDSERFRPRIQQLQEERKLKDGSGSYLLAHLISYVSNDRENPKLRQRLLDDAENLGLKMGSVQTPYGVYSFLQATETDEGIKAECGSQLAALEKGKALPQIVWDMIRSTGTDDLVQLAIMAGASKVGSIARLAVLTRLEKAGVGGYKALALGYGSMIATEGTAMWALSTVHEAMLHDPEKVFESKKLLKSWGANLIMIAGLKASGGMAGKLLPSVAKFLGFVEQGRLNRMGLSVVWGLNHFAGISGMVGTTQLNQALGLSEAPKGGLKESLAHDVFTYIKYGIAQKGVDRVLGGEFVRAREVREGKIREKEAQLLKAAPEGKRPASILESPLLGPFWMMMGVEGLVGGGGGGKNPGIWSRMWNRSRPQQLVTNLAVEPPSVPYRSKFLELPLDFHKTQVKGSVGSEKVQVGEISEAVMRQYLDESGKLMLIVEGTQAIEGVRVKDQDHALFHDNGRLASATLSEPQTIQGIPCTGTIYFDRNGRLEGSTLSAPLFTSSWELQKGDVVGFDAKGGIRTIQFKDPYRIGGEELGSVWVDEVGKVVEVNAASGKSASQLREEWFGYRFLENHQIPSHLRTFALAQFGDPRAIQKLQNLLKIKSGWLLDPSTRSMAAFYLGRLKAREAVPTLLEIVRDSNEREQLRAEALRALEKIVGNPVHDGPSLTSTLPAEAFVQSRILRGQVVTGVGGSLSWGALWMAGASPNVLLCASAMIGLLFWAVSARYNRRIYGSRVKQVENALPTRLLVDTPPPRLSLRLRFGTSPTRLRVDTPPPEAVTTEPANRESMAEAEADAALQERRRENR